MVLFDGENVKAFTGVKEMGYLAEGQVTRRLSW
jgi:hypothetical protein